MNDPLWTTFCQDVDEEERDGVLTAICEAAHDPSYHSDFIKISGFERRNALSVTAYGSILIHGKVYSFYISSGDSQGTELLDWEFEYTQPLL